MIETQRTTEPSTDVSEIERLALVDPTEISRRVGVRIERPLGRARGPVPYVVLCHGFKGFMDWGFFPALSRAIARAGLVAVSMNASGSGVRDDPLAMDDDEAFFRDTYTRQLEDIERVRRFARRIDGVDASSEVLLGHSRGGGMMVVSAAEEQPAAVVVWAAIDEADRFGEDAKQSWRRDGVLLVPNGRTGQTHRMSVEALDDLERHRERLDVLAAAGRIDAPLLALHGSDDATVAPEAAARIADAAPRGAFRILPDADHAFGARHPCPDPSELPALTEAIDATLAFLRDALDR